MRGRIRSGNSNRRDFRSRRQQRSGNFRFVRRGDRDSFRSNRRNFNSRRTKFSKPYRKRENLNQEKLDDDLDNYFERKGGDSLKDRLDNDLEMYKKNAPMNENLKKEVISLPPQQKEEEKKEAEPPKENVEMKTEEPQNEEPKK